MSWVHTFSDFSIMRYMKGLDDTLSTGDKSIISGYYLHYVKVYQNDGCYIVSVGDFKLISLMRVFGYPGNKENL